jgi:hypothetical protein
MLVRDLIRNGERKAIEHRDTPIFTVTPLGCRFRTLSDQRQRRVDLVFEFRAETHLSRLVIVHLSIDLRDGEPMDSGDSPTRARGPAVTHVRAVLIDRHRLRRAGVHFSGATSDLGIPCLMAPDSGFGSRLRNSSSARRARSSGSDMRQLLTSRREPGNVRSHRHRRRVPLVDIAEYQHRTHSPGRIAREPHVTERVRVDEGAHEHVPERKIAVVPGVGPRAHGATRATPAAG